MKATLYLLLATCCVFSATGARCENRPVNILWIIADDLGVELSCYGEQAASTPNLDRLAAEGVRYTRAFATAPVCSSSRTAFITGMYQTKLGGHHHRTRNLKPLPAIIKPLGEYFKKAGYHVSNAGTKSRSRGKTDYNFTPEGQLYQVADWSKQTPESPFFAQVQIHEPHRPFLKNTDPSRIAKISLPPYYPDHPVILADWANYLESVEEMDRKVGEILDRLKKTGLAQNTIVFFFGDHGRPHFRDKQWLYDGGLHIPLIIRWPGKLKAGGVDSRMLSMIDFAPSSLAAAGLDIPEAMQGSNIFAADFKGHTAIYAARDRCGDAVDRIRCVRTERYKYIRNFMPEIPYTTFSGYKKLQYPASTLMTLMHKQNQLTPEQALFMAPSRPKEELYDLENDPYELNNLASDALQSETLIKLRHKLDQWIEKTNDQGRVQEGDAEYMSALMKGKKAYFEKTMEKRGLNPNIPDQDYLDWWEKELNLK